MSKIEIAIEQFDMEEYVSDKIGRVLGYVDNHRQVRTFCPFCESRDTKGKMYVHLENKVVFCQRCHYGVGIRLPKFISDVENISYNAAIELILESVQRSYGDLDLLEERLNNDTSAEVPKEELNAGTVQLPEGSVELFGKDRGMLVKKAEKYLLRRGITSKQVKNHRFFLGMEGKYRQRVIIPVYFHDELVHWVARDLLNREGVEKYLTPPSVNQSLWLFNWDRVRKESSVVVVEGVFDALAVERAGFSVVASFGKGLSSVQRRLLRRFEDIVIMYDSDALTDAYDAAQLIGDHVRVANVPQGDPEDIGQAAIKQLVASAPGVNSPNALTQLFEVL